jgi:hypothetical protein
MILKMKGEVKKEFASKLKEAEGSLIGRVNEQNDCGNRWDGLKVRLGLLWD